MDNPNDDLTTYKEKLKDVDVQEWKKAMDCGMESMDSNSVWSLVEVPKGQMDVKTTFVNGKLEEDIYMQQSKGFIAKGQEHMVCKLYRLICELKQASRSWNSRFDETIEMFGFEKSPDELCVYKEIQGSVIVFLILYVDDILLIGNNVKVLSVAKYSLETSKMGFLPFKRGMHLSKKQSTKTPEEKEFINLDFQRDIDFSKSMLSYVFSLNGGAISWRSIKQTSVADSTTEAKYVAASETAKKAVWFKKFFMDLQIIPVGHLVSDPADHDEEGICIIDWLDKKEKSSTVYAHGLELSNVNFIRVIRFPEGKKMELKDALPEGFLERVNEKGMVIENWAPQVKILDHSSIGGLVSQCGWSSIMESLRFGVPIIAMPMQHDQPWNA
ncbi:flavanone 7-O-glucoside 2''-O-beta-L-rhamnosyltransferase-like [Ziziphus jujuba]|uniref:Flavanone 7-O-glucoside 2''-O-beta-L-rhamnosyltransferase-like n=1 Tax=Ziziphus jujuba TaxID=326968 RepID=A0ABM4A7S5_ZIZJJ|nr:flavanone 7-O-glucoside 2''-O-beta-L-rhamnosyltransferase-like [Ziziphus jujuba]